MSFFDFISNINDIFSTNYTNYINYINYTNYTNYKSNQELVKWHQSKWLVLSSLSFLPTVYKSYLQKYYYLSGGLFIVTFSSMNYWRKATNGWRRQIDFFTSKTMALYMFYNGIQYIDMNSLAGVYFTICVMFIYCYNRSNQLYLLQNENWMYYHIFFHILGSVNTYTVITYLPEVL